MTRIRSAAWPATSLLVFGLLLLPVTPALVTTASAQGVTTAAITGVVKDASGSVVPGATVTATHVPSGSTYEAVTNGEGRYFLPAMRVGGPYTIVAALSGFQNDERKDITLSLGVTQTIELTLKVAALSTTETVVGKADPVFSASRTGAATAITRDQLAVLPTITGRMNDITRTTPQFGGGGTFAGQDNRLNNITVDGSYFNNSFGLGGQPGDRTGVAPISLEAIEQVQVSIAPYDVRQGNFVGAGVNTVTRSGTNSYTGSAYTRYRNEDFVGKTAKGNAFNPGTFKTKATGGWAGGPIVKNKWFVFGSYEKQDDSRPLSNFTANTGGQTVGGNTTRVLASDLTALSNFLKTKFNYETGPYEGISKKTPAKPLLVKTDFNLSSTQKVTFRYSQLNSSSDQILSTSSSLGFGRGSNNSTNFLSFQGSNYAIMENYKSGILEYNAVIKNTMANNLIVGYTTNDESRSPLSSLFPFVDILDGAGVAYTSFGSEPFTPHNELRYKTFQAQNNFTKFGAKHTLTFGLALEKYNSENVFFPGEQSAYVYNTLADFYTDANDYLVNPNRTASPITLRRFQVRYNNIPGQEKPVQPLEVWYSSVYAQDEWKPKSNVTITAGLRVDTPKFSNTAFANTAVDGLTFRAQDGSAVKYATGKLPNATPLWSPRVGFNWDVKGDQTFQVRGGTGVFTGKPAYVWISNQIGNTGVLTGFVQNDNTKANPFSPNIDKYKPTSVTGAPAASVDLAVTDPDFKFPQVWRTNLAVDKRLGWGVVATGEFIYNQDVNGVAYFNANLPAAQANFVGVDNRMRWTGTSCSAATATPCVTRLNNVSGNQITNAIVLSNQGVGKSWNIAGTLSKSSRDYQVKAAYSYGESKNTVDAGSIASGSFTGNPVQNDPNNPTLGYSAASPGHRVFVSANVTKEYFHFGSTSLAVYWEARTIGNGSYIFSGDMNGDSATSNDLIYIPRDTSEMNFVAFTASGRTFTAAEQAAAFDAYILQDKYLSKHRGEYAVRGAVFLPFVNRMDLSLTQDLFRNLGGKRHTAQIRLDIQNFGNMLNSDWGVSQRLLANQILTNAAADSNGKVSYRMAVVNGALPTSSLQATTTSSDVYTMMLSFRYSFR